MTKNTQHMKEQNKNQIQINEEEIGNLSEKEFRVMILKNPTVSTENQLLKGTDIVYTRKKT